MSAAPEIQVRSRRHAALRGALRALGEALDPADLEHALALSREVLGRLRALAERAGEAGPDAGGLRQVDRGLEALTARTLGLLHGLAHEAGRQLFGRLAHEQPDAVRGIAEALLTSDLASDDDLRLLEFLVTLLCCERRGAEKVVARTPLEAVPLLEEVYAAMQVELDSDAASAEQTFRAAAEALRDREDVDETRDHMRRAKRALGVRMLHPQVFAALVAYNVAMSNRVEALIEEGGLQDALKRELQELGPAEGAPNDSIFDSEGFRRLVEALRRYVKGEPCADAPALRLARRCDLEALAPGEVEMFAAPEEASQAWLAQAAVALGLVLSRLDEARPALGEVGIDPEQVAGPWPAELRRAMTAAAQNLLADGRFAEAQRLAAVRTRQLAEHRVGLGASRGSNARPRRPAPQTLPQTPVRSPFLWRTVGAAVVLVGLLLFAALEWPSRDPGVITRAQLAALSPHLVSAYRTSSDGLPKLIGTVGAEWVTLADAERRAAIAELGRRAREMGIANVSVVDAQNRLLGRYQDGDVVWFAAVGGR